MNKIKKFMDNDILLTPSIYEKIKNMDEEELNGLLKTKELFLDDLQSEVNNNKDNGQKELKKGKKITEDFETTLNIVKKSNNVSGKYKISDFVDFFNKRFDKLKDILKKRVDNKNLISINKLSSYGIEGTIIGIVRDVEDDYVSVEDNTSSVKVKTEENLVEDEVIGIEGKKNKDRFVADKIYYPDLPFKREINTLDKEENGLFISGINSENFDRIKKIMDKKDVDYLFITGDMELNNYENFLKDLGIEGILVSKNENHKNKVVGRINISTNPTWSGIFDKITILQYKFKNYGEYKKKLKINSSRDVTLRLLKTRHLDPSGKNFFDDDLLLDNLPDIIHCSNLDDFSVYNYKGTTVVNTTQERGVLVNFNTREIEEIELKNM